MRVGDEIGNLGLNELEADYRKKTWMYRATRTIGEVVLVVLMFGSMLLACWALGVSMEV